MDRDQFIYDLKHLIGEERQRAYKNGFTDGIAFISEPSTQLTDAFNKAKDHALAQVDDLYGRGKEYGVALEVVNAIFNDLMNAAHLQQPSKIEDFWEDEYGDDL